MTKFRARVTAEVSVQVDESLTDDPRAFAERLAFEAIAYGTLPVDGDSSCKVSINNVEVDLTGTA